MRFSWTAELRTDMGRKIFKSIIFVALIVMAASLFIMMSAMSSFYTKEQMGQLRSETELLAAGIELEGMDYIEGLDKDSSIRITWVDQDGDVLYDTDMDSAIMENHVAREEISEAMKDGYGESARFSNSLSERLLYSAKRLNDGTVIRVALAQATAWTVLINFAVPVTAVIVIAVILSMLFAGSLTKRIIQPINDMDLDAPLKNEIYVEMKPFAERIDEQQKQLKKDKEALIKNEQIRQEFTENVSHELKTPLQVISGYAELIRAGIVKEGDIRPFADKIYTEAQRLTALVEDVIDLTRLDNGGQGYQWEETDVYMIAENVVESLLNTAEAEKVHISLSGKSTRIYTVSQLLHSIIYNLCDNAIKYNRTGGSVNVSIRKAGENVLITVSDTVIGIPEDCLDRVFERFYRVDKSRSKEVRGTGLGLSIVKHAARIIDGDLKVDSHIGRGSEFTLTLPARHKETFMRNL